MNLDFDYRRFQREQMGRLAEIFAESCSEEKSQNEFDRTYDMIQSLLSCRKMCKCHPYLYTLDQENLNESDRKKVEDLYECAVKRGFVRGEETNEGEIGAMDVGQEPDPYADRLCGSPDDSLTPLGMDNTPAARTSDCANPSFTVLYSALKDGQPKVGEYYSNALDMESAKRECISRVAGLGCTAIRVLGVEQTGAVDPNVAQEQPGVNLYDVYEDDSKEFEKQETGDVSSGSEAENKTDDVPSSGVGNDSDTKDGTLDGDSEKADEPNQKEPKRDGKTPEQENPSDDGSGENNDEPNDDENGEEPSESPAGEQRKLTSDERNSLREEYTRVFKDVLKKVNLGKSFIEMTLQEKMDFLKTLSGKWTKSDPAEFLTDKEFEKLNRTVVKQEDPDAK